MSRKDVRITSDDGQVDKDEVKINRELNEEVVWFSHDGKSAIIVFASPDGSPFQETQFQVPAGGSVSSGPARHAKKKRYKYAVVGRTGVNDPIIIIDP